VLKKWQIVKDDQQLTMTPSSTFEQTFWSDMEKKARLEELAKSTQDISDILWQRHLEERIGK